jgi:hypothetical protein
MKIVRGTPAARAKMSVATKKYFEDPEAIAKHSDIMKRVQGTPEARAKQSATTKAVWAARRANRKITPR